MSTTTLPRRRKLDVHAYHRMAEVGIFGADERVELIDGEIVEMVPIGSEHGGLTSRLARRFVLAVGDRAVVNTTSPLRVDDRSEPQPDLMLLRPRGDDYMRSHPRPADVLLLVEVANASLDYDRTVKAPLYARAGVAELWIVDLRSRAVEVATAPGAAGFAAQERVSRGAVSPRALPDVSIDLATLFAA
ncbi:MAG: Uma2 family endonuclease [Alphaproteobacteria bacterium]|jgi:Uma2 family endonuclease|nr:Uma2 family endonuclease [Alphaproteobacteria bacterium]